MRSLLLVTLVAAAAASPLGAQLQERGTTTAKTTAKTTATANFCSVVNEVVSEFAVGGAFPPLTRLNQVTILHQESAATVFCSSYLSIPAGVTVTSTTTETT